MLSSSLAQNLFKGSYPTEAALTAENGNPSEGWTYYNTAIGQTLTFHKNAWYQYTIDGENGTASDYKGEFSVAPLNPVTDDAYLDSVDGVVYIYNGVAWEVMSQAGTGIAVTYNDSNLDATPSNPTGTGETGGWHLDATVDVNWISQKVGAGDWGIPLAAKNLGSALVDYDELSEISTDLGNITGGSITLSGLNGSEEPEATALYQMRMDGGGIQGRWRASGDPTAWGAWRNIIDITGNEVKLSFDSFDLGETISGIATNVVAGNKLVFGVPPSSQVDGTGTGYHDISGTSDTFSLANVDQGPFSAELTVAVAHAASTYYMRLKVFDASDDSFLGFTADSNGIVWSSLPNTIETFTWASSDEFVDAGAEVGMDIYCTRQFRSGAGSGGSIKNTGVTEALRVENVQASSTIVKT